MGMAEFRMETNLAEVTPKSLDFNFEELKAFLSENLKTYKGLVVTEDIIKDASEVKARINKVASAIKEHRIAIKKEYEAPYLAFKEQCDELEGMCKEVTDAIGKQLDMFEDERRAEKKALIEEYFNSEITEDAKEYLTFDEIFDNKWTNKTFAIDEAKKTVLEKIKETDTAVNAIRNLNSEFTTTLLEHFRKTHNLIDCINKNKELYERKQAEERRQAELEKAKATQSAPKAEPPKAEVPQAVEETQTVKPQAAKPKMLKLIYKVYCTEQEVNMIDDLLVSRSIRHSKKEVE